MIKTKTATKWIDRNTAAKILGYQVRTLRSLRQKNMLIREIHYRQINSNRILYNEQACKQLVDLGFNTDAQLKEVVAQQMQDLYLQNKEIYPNQEAENAC